MRIKFGILLLALVLSFSTFSTAFASGNELYPAFTQEMLEEIERNNQRVEDYMAARIQTRALSEKKLSITPIEQENNSYCGPACAKMAADYVGLRDSNGRKFTQSSIAQIIGYTSSAGTYSGDIAIGMNNLLDQQVYELTQTNKSNLADSLVYGINNDYPMFINVKKLPNYPSAVASGHFILGVGYTIYTQGGSTVVSNVTYNDPRPNYASQYTITTDQMVTACNSNAGNFVRAVP